MTPVIGVIVIVEITCQPGPAADLVPLTDSDRGEGSAACPLDGSATDNKEPCAPDNSPVNADCKLGILRQIVVIHFDKGSKKSKERGKESELCICLGVST